VLCHWDFQKLQDISYTGGKHGAGLKWDRRKRPRKVAKSFSTMCMHQELSKTLPITAALDNAMEIIKKLNPSQGIHYTLSNIVTDRPTSYMCLIVYV